MTSRPGTRLKNMASSRDTYFAPKGQSRSRDIRQAEVFDTTRRGYETRSCRVPRHELASSVLEQVRDGVHQIGTTLMLQSQVRGGRFGLPCPTSWSEPI